jgi:hypothetical protein
MKSRPNYAHRIAKEYDGILPYHQVFYIRSIRFSAGRAASAFARLRERVNIHHTEADTEEIVFTLQEALAHSAAVSRYFWPVSDEKLAAARGKNLRTIFSLDEADPLFHVRSIRNTIEHFDERLDRFCSRDPVGTVFDLIVSDSALADEQVTHVLRLVDPDDEIFVLFGKKHSYAGLEDSIRRIHLQSCRMDECGGRLRADGDQPEAAKSA